ncbi:hypothetical protein Hypma_010857 [Hypsizygus marmoreus]|uniref:DUF7770 domain-containing protein n=1 Tax=Hypsizygus marmoreus TaxID=39966 RepID=A0A369JIV1_HYPMA|nr:hypothetical protein Hypma_010857 [Hypsizygus marmoreus]
MFRKIVIDINTDLLAIRSGATLARFSDIPTMSQNIYIYPKASALLSAKVDSIQILGGPPVEGGSHNHWRMFFIIDPSTAFCFDMSVGGDGRTGVLIIQDVPYPNRDDMEKPFAIVPLSFTTTHTIQDIITSLTKHSMECYRFTPEGDGCRHWIRQVVRMWEAEGRLPAGSRSKLDESILFFWTSPTESRESPPAVGDFYSN